MLTNTCMICPWGSVWTSSEHGSQASRDSTPENRYLAVLCSIRSHRVLLPWWPSAGQGKNKCHPGWKGEDVESPFSQFNGKYDDLYIWKKMEIWKDPNLGVSEHISQGDQLWVQEVYTYTLYVDICSTPMWICTIQTCTCIIFLKCFPIMRLLALTLFGVQMKIIFEEGGTVWIWNETWESILASMEFHSSEDLGCSLQNPSLHVPSFSLLFSDFTWTFLLLHKGVWPFWSQISHMCWYCCVLHHHFTLRWLNPSARPGSPGLY